MEQFRKPNPRLKECIKQDKVRKHGPLFQCLNEEICRHKIDIGYKKFCTDDKENGGWLNGKVQKR